MQYGALHAGFWNTGTFWVTVAVLLFLAVFGRRLFGGVIGAIDARTDGIRHEIEEARRLRGEAEQMLREAEQRQAEALRIAREMTADARGRADRMAGELARAAEATQGRREKMIADRIEAASAAAVKEVREAATSLAIEVTSRVLRDGFDAARDADAIDQAIEGLPAALSRRAA